MGWTIGVLEFNSQQGLGIFLFTTASRIAWGPTQPPIQRVPGALSQGVRWLGREAHHSPPSSAKVKEWVVLYLHSPNTPSWHGAQLKKAQGQLHLYFFINNQGISSRQSGTGAGFPPSTSFYPTNCNHTNATYSSKVYERLDQPACYYNPVPQSGLHLTGLRARTFHCTDNQPKKLQPNILQ
jgi:hypothetical protein